MGFRDAASWIVFGILIAIILLSDALDWELIPHPGVTYLLIAVISIFVIMKSAGFAIQAITDYAYHTGISKYLVGFLVVSVGTSIPDLSTAFIASLSGEGTLILGNVLGANIMDITLLLGLSAIVAHKLTIKGEILHKSLPTVCIMTSLPILLGMDGALTRFDGAILLGAFLVYTGRLFYKEGTFGHIKKQVPFRDIWKDMVVFVGCIIALLLASKWLVLSSVHLAKSLDVSTFLIGLVFVAVATTVPELVIAIKSAIGHQINLTFGDILGAVTINSSLVLGLAAMLNPIRFSTKPFLIAAMFMITSVYIGTTYIRKKEITWHEGIGLLLIYATFLISQTLA